MSNFLIMFVSQLLFQLARIYSTRLVSRDHMFGTMIMTQIVQALWLLTTALGVHAAFEMDWWMITGYMVGGGIGAYMAMKITWHK